MMTSRGSCHRGRVDRLIQGEAELAPRCPEGVDLGSVERGAFDGLSWELRPDAPHTGIWNDGSSRSPR